MATNEILPFASTNTGTNLLTQAEYTSDAQRTIGHQPGIARAKLENKVLRQTSLIAAGVAQFIAQYQANNVTDSLTKEQVAEYLLAAVQYQIPSGVIVMWSGLMANIPTGWLLCNGSNGTPDLRDRFIVGAAQDFSGAPATNITGSLTKTGGSKDSVVVSHTHTATVTDPGHNHTITGFQVYGSSGIPAGGNNVLVAGTPPAPVSTSTTGVTVQNASTGTSGVNQNLPPYYALAFIMKA